MVIAAARAEFTDVLTKVLSAVPAGFVFDEVYIIDKLSAEHPEEYLKFCATYDDREKPAEMAAEEICATIKRFEGIFVEEQDLEAFVPTLHSSLSRHRVWKKI